MGLDRSYASLPDGCEVLRRSLADPEYGSLLQFIGHYYDEAANAFRSCWEGEPYRSFVADLNAMHARRNGARQLLYDGYSRAWDLLHYLLSPSRRAGAQHGQRDDMGTRFVCGTVLLPEQLRAVQGCRYGYSTAAEVRAVACWAGTLDRVALERHFDPAAMEHGGIYKFFRGQEERDLEWAWSHAGELRAFYQAAAAAGEGAIVSTD